MTGADKEREVREQLITQLKSALENAGEGDLFMDEDGDVYDNVFDATNSADVGEIVTLTRYIQLPSCFVHVTDRTAKAYLTEEGAEAAAEEDPAPEDED